eukprot:1158903-Pelagomonas_calceolata.AAC.16
MALDMGNLATRHANEGHCNVQNKRSTASYALQTMTRAHTRVPCTTCTYAPPFHPTCNNPCLAPQQAITLPSGASCAEQRGACKCSSWGRRGLIAPAGTCGKLEIKY